MVNVKLAPKAWAERIRLPRFKDFDIRSAPMAKYPRARGGQDGGGGGKADVSWDMGSIGNLDLKALLRREAKQST